MVVVPPAEFMMGSTDAEGDWFLKQGGEQKNLDWESPRPQVMVGQYRKFTKATGRPDGDGCYVYEKFEGKGQWKKQADRN